jgi:hypothetical protein
VALMTAPLLQVTGVGKHLVWFVALGCADVIIATIGLVGLVHDRLKARGR